MILQRLKNLWKISEFQPAEPMVKYEQPGTIISPLVKIPNKQATFIPRIKEKPIDKITKLGEETV